MRMEILKLFTSTAETALQLGKKTVSGDDVWVLQWHPKTKC